MLGYRDAAPRSVRISVPDQGSVFDLEVMSLRFGGAGANASDVIRRGGRLKVWKRQAIASGMAAAVRVRSRRLLPFAAKRYSLLAPAAGRACAHAFGPIGPLSGGRTPVFKVMLTIAVSRRMTRGRLADERAVRPELAVLPLRS